MSKPITTFAAALSDAANLSHRATTGQPVTIGRAVFLADEIKPVLAHLHAPAAPTADDCGGYTVEIDHIFTDQTPVSGCGCDGPQRTVGDVVGIGACSLTPGDPSPIGRCPDCDGLVYVPAAPDPRDGIIAELVAALGRAESFMAGFEDDELQEGMEGLLGSTRAALANAAALQAGQ